MKELATIKLRGSQRRLRADRSDRQRLCRGWPSAAEFPFGTPSKYQESLVQGRISKAYSARFWAAVHTFRHCPPPLVRAIPSTARARLRACGRRRRGDLARHGDQGGPDRV